MITITKLIEVSGVAPYQVFVNTSGEASVEQVTNSIYRITTLYNDEIGTGDTVTVIDDLGCIRSLPLQITDPCDTFFVSEIVRQSGPGNPTQTTTTTPSVYNITSNQTVTVDWTLDNPELYLFLEQGSQATLTQVSTNSEIVTTNLRAIVTNTNGCTQERRFQLSPCVPRAQNSSTVMRLNDEGVYEKLRVPMSASSSCGTIDWSTAILANNNLLTIEQIPGQPYLNISSPISINTNIFFSVADETGQRSNVARISVTSTEELANTENDGTGGVQGTVGPVIFPNGINGLDYPLNELGINNPNGLSINTTLTTANSASINGNNLIADVTGQQTSSVGINTQSGPNVITFVRDLTTYTPGPTTLDVGCGTVISNLTSVSGVDTVNSIISGDATLSGSFITISEDDQIVKVSVSNDDGQTGTLDVYACRTCGADFSRTTCESTNVLYNFINAPTGGTWTSTTVGAPIPASYNDSVTLTTGTYLYTYNVVNSVTQCPNPITYNLTLVKEDATLVSNDECVNAELLIPITNGDDTQSFTNESISSSCSSQTTWSGDKGLMSTHLYDQWFKYDSSTPVGFTDVLNTIKVIGTGNNPVQIPSVQIWDTCGTTLNNVTYSQSGNTATAVFTLPANASREVTVQVLSDTTGNYRLEVLQEVQ